MGLILERREWVYAQHPTVYEIRCNYCGGTDIDWSEFKGRIWCYDCHCDVTGTGGIFDGQIGVKTCAILGIYFDRIDLRTGKIYRLAIKIR